MSNEMDQEIKNHEYDGIKEYDNPLPNWWLVTFYGAIIFAVGYYIYYELGSGPNLDQELQGEMTQIKAMQPAAPQADSEADLNAKIADANLQSAGAGVFAGKCAVCHGAELQGQIGPNLVDNYWIHGGKPADIAKIIRTGVGDKGMPPWQGVLKDDEIYAVLAYIVSKKGSNPPNPKAPQGEKVE